MSRLWSSIRFSAHTRPKLWRAMAGDETNSTVAMDMLPRVISVWQDCVRNYSLEACAFAKQPKMIHFQSNTSTNGSVFFNASRQSIYHVYIQEYLNYFPPGNILVIPTEDLVEHKLRDTMWQVFSFLNVSLPMNIVKESREFKYTDNSNFS